MGKLCINFCGSTPRKARRVNFAMITAVMMGHWSISPNSFSTLQRLSRIKIFDVDFSSEFISLVKIRVGVTPCGSVREVS